MITKQYDSHVHRLLTHSDELLRRSEKALHRSQQTTVDTAKLIEYDRQLTTYVNELLAQVAPPRQQ